MSTPQSTLTPGEMADRTGVSLDTLRYYEAEGLLTDVERAPNGHRRYRTDDVLWVEVLRCLRQTGMTIDQLRHYCSLGEQGAVTKPERKQLLLDHRALVAGQIDELERAVELIDHKLAHYADTPSHTIASDPVGTASDTADLEVTS